MEEREIRGPRSGGEPPRRLAGRASSLSGLARGQDGPDTAAPRPQRHSPSRLQERAASSLPSGSRTQHHSRPQEDRQRRQNLSRQVPVPFYSKTARKLTSRAFHELARQGSSRHRAPRLRGSSDHQRMCTRSMAPAQLYTLRIRGALAEFSRQMYIQIIIT